MELLGFHAWCWNGCHPTNYEADRRRVWDWEEILVLASWKEGRRRVARTNSAEGSPRRGQLCPSSRLEVITNPFDYDRLVIAQAFCLFSIPPTSLFLQGRSLINPNGGTWTQNLSIRQSPLGTLGEDMASWSPMEENILRCGTLGKSLTKQ